MMTPVEKGNKICCGPADQFGQRGARGPSPGSPSLPVPLGIARVTACTGRGPPTQVFFADLDRTAPTKRFVVTRRPQQTVVEQNTVKSLAATLRTTAIAVRGNAATGDVK